MSRPLQEEKITLPEDRLSGAGENALLRYRVIGNFLRGAPEIESLNQKIDLCLQSTVVWKPFVVVTGSSGVGKTQALFALENNTRKRYVYLLGDKFSRRQIQAVHEAFLLPSTAFNVAVEFEARRARDHLRLRAVDP